MKHPSDGKLQVLGGLPVPARFGADNVEQDERFVAHFDVVVVNGRPCVERVVLEPPRLVDWAALDRAHRNGERLDVVPVVPLEPFTVDELAGVSLSRLLGQALDVALQRFVYEARPDVQGDEMERVAATASRRARRKRTITHEFLAEVVDEYGRNGVPGVMARWPSAERTVRYWLARAREEGLR